MMVIYLQQRKLAQTAQIDFRKDGTYGEEIMQANWNPAVMQVRETIPAVESPELPDDGSTIDTEAFLNRVYALASLV